MQGLQAPKGVPFPDRVTHIPDKTDIQVVYIPDLQAGVQQGLLRKYRGRLQGQRMLMSPARLDSGQEAPEIRLIASDVDGTLLNHQQDLTPRVEEAIKAAGKCGVPVSSGLRSPGKEEGNTRCSCYLTGGHLPSAAGCCHREKQRALGPGSVPSDQYGTPRHLLAGGTTLSLSEDLSSFLFILMGNF